MLRIENMKILNGREVSLTLNAGEGIFLTGENGAGKSLFLKSVARLSPATFKTFQWNQKSISDWSPEVYRREVMYISAASYASKVMTVQEYFSQVLNFGVYKDYQSQFDYLSVLEKWKIPLNDFSFLSSGQKQMISILRALTLNPTILLLDEPTANLDQDKTLAVEELIRHFLKDTNKSVVWVSHSSEQINRMGFPVLAI